MLAPPMHGLLLADTPADPNSTSSWIAIVIALLTIIYICFVRPAKKKRERDPLARQPNQSSLLAQQRAIEGDMTALLVEYEQMMRTMSAQIDMRTTKLDLLLREADEKIGALKAAAAAAAQAAAPIVPVPETPAAAKQLPIVQATPETPPVVTSPAAHAEKLVREARELADAIDVEIAATADSNDPHAQIYAMADRGLTYRQIAHELDRAYGEVELILAIRPKGSSDAPIIERARTDSEQTSESQPHRRNKQRRKQHT
jgi:hypothetical protein